MSAGKLPERFSRIVDGVSENDRRWFEAHPKADRRLRELIPGEFGPDAILTTDTVIVLQLAPGVRVRRLVAIVAPNDPRADGVDLWEGAS